MPLRFSPGIFIFLLFYLLTFVVTSGAIHLPTDGEIPAPNHRGSGFLYPRRLIEEHQLQDEKQPDTFDAIPTPETQGQAEPKVTKPLIVRLPIMKGGPAKNAHVEARDLEHHQEAEIEDPAHTCTKDDEEGTCLAPRSYYSHDGENGAPEDEEQYAGNDRNVLLPRDPYVPYPHRRPSYTPSIHTSNLDRRSDESWLENCPRCVVCEPCKGYSQPGRTCTPNSGDVDGECDSPNKDHVHIHYRRDPVQHGHILKYHEDDRDREDRLIKREVARGPDHHRGRNHLIQERSPPPDDTDTDFHPTYMNYKRSAEPLPKRKGNGKKKGKSPKYTCQGKRCAALGMQKPKMKKRGVVNGMYARDYDNDERFDL